MKKKTVITTEKYEVWIIRQPSGETTEHEIEGNEAEPLEEMSKSFVNALRIVREPFSSRVMIRVLHKARAAFLLIAILASLGVSAFGQTTAFTYQGRLADGGNPADGPYNMQFKLFDTATVGTGTELGSTPNLSVQVTSGVFTVQLDFGAGVFTGAARFLEIALRPAGSADPHTILAPRQPVTSTPFAIRSSVAAVADGLSVSCVNCVTSSQIQSVAGSQVSGGAGITNLNASNITSGTLNNARLGLVPIANGGTGSATQNFVDLTNAQTIGGNKTFANTIRVSNGLSGAVAASGADLVVDDNSSAFQHFLTPNDFESGILFGDPTDSIAGGIVFNNAATNNGIQFRTGGNNTRMTLDGSGNLGISGTFTGSGAGLTNLDASKILSGTLNNARLGIVPIANGGTGSATQNFVDLTNAQTIGGNKTFSNTMRVSNGLSGAVAAPSADLVVDDNFAAFQQFLTPNDIESGILFGDPTDSIAGGIVFNNPATNNGIQFRTGGNNTRMTLDGSGNLGISGTFTGSGAGLTNLDASNILSGTLNNARLGVVPVANGGTGSATQTFVDLTTSQTIGGNKTLSGTLSVIGNSSSAGTPVSIFQSAGSQVPIAFRSGGSEVARVRADSQGNLVLATLNGTDKDIYFRAGDDSGTDMFIQSSSGNVGIGTTAPGHPLTVGQADTPVGTGAKVGIYGAGIADIIVRDTTDNVEGVFSVNGDRVIYGALTNHEVQFRTNNTTRMTILNNGNVDINGAIRFNVQGGPGGGDLCATTNVPMSSIFFCGSSLRYKSDVRDFTPGLDLLSRLRPVTFRWKESGQADLGLIAEEVAEVEPLMVTHNKDGLVDGVKYNRVGVVLINAVKEQQAQIASQDRRNETQQKQIDEQKETMKRQQAEIEALKKLVCAQNPQAESCKKKQ